MKTKTFTNRTNYWFVIVFLLFSSSFFGQTTYVPDDNFENYLETHDANGNVVAIGDPNSMGNGIANDDYVLTNRINTVTNLDVSNVSPNITDLTGISGFIALINLNCSDNTLGILDVSANTVLEVLICNGYSVPFSGDQPAISSLNLGTISSLKTLSCSINALTALDLTNQTNLISLDCSFGNLTSLNLTNQINLTTLDFSGNNLNSINLTNQTNLISLKCNYNNIGTLDVSNNTALEILECAGKYESTGFITNVVTITPNVNTLVLGSVNSIKTLNCANNLMTSLPLTNLNYLEVLDCSVNNLGSLDVSNKTNLIKLYCEGYTERLDLIDPTLTYHPNISSLNLGSINKIKELKCYSNNLSSLDVSNLNLLEVLNIRENSISTLNLSNNVNLTDVYCGVNNLEVLDVKNGNNNSIVNFDARDNTSLICLQVDDAVAANAGTGVYASWQKDASITFGDNCATYVPDIIFEAYLETHDANGNIVSSALSMGNGISGDQYVTTSNINTVTNLDVSGLTISDLTGIEDFTALAIFNCSANSLTSLDVSSNTALLVLDCFSNSLTSLDVSNNIALQNLGCFQNAITSLNISQNTNLKALNCEFNQLTQLNVANGNNANFTDFKATSNPNLNCIQIDTGFTPTFPIWQKDATAHYGNDCIETYVPNNNFETYLETHDANGNVVTVGDSSSMGNGIANDDYVTTSKISGVTNLDVSNLSISDLTGIEDFTALTNLNCSGNNGLSIDISQNTALTNLNVSGCTLSSLDVSANTSLTYLDCSGNNLTSLNLTQNTLLTYLNCGNNNLTSLGLSQNTALTTLYCYSNQLTTLNVSQNTNLTLLETSQNQITYLDVSQNTALTELYCYTNQLTSLSVYYNNNLQKLHCANNQITNLILPNVKTNLIEVRTFINQLTSLDISDYTNVNQILCNNNQLQQLNVKNGNNTNITNANFNATNNPNLTCIEVGDAAWSTTNWTNIDATASFSNNCNFNETYVPDDNFEAYLEANGMGNGIANDDYVTTSNINTVTSLIINNRNISDLTGIEDFTALENLDCEYNQISTVDFSNNTALVSLYCNNNSISILDLTVNTALQTLYCNDNTINDIQLSPASLVNLYCENNQISLLDLSNFFNLENVHCYNNSITSLDLLNSAGNLIDFRCNDNQLTSLDIDANINLTTFHCGNNQLTNLVLTTNTALEDVRCDNNQLTTLDVTQNTALRVLLVNNNNIANIDIAQNTALTDFFCNNNQLTNLDVSQNMALVELRCQNNQLTDLISPSTVLQFLNCNDNSLTDLDVSQNTALADLKCSGNQLTEIDLSANAQLAAFNGSANDLTKLIIKNGNNTAITTAYFDATGNANLTCIEVDDVAYTTANWTNIDPQTSFNANCNYGETYVPDNNFEQALINLGFDLVLDDYVTTSNINSLTVLDLSSLNISDLTGIEDFIALVNLDVSANNITSLDITNNTALTLLYCGANNITSLDVQLNVLLTELIVTQNQLTGLDVTQNVNLQFLACEGNPFNSGLDITQNILLQQLIANDLNLTSLDISQNDDLQTIDCSYNAITALDFTGKQDLTEVRCQNNQLTDVYLRENPSLTFVDVSDNLLTDFTIDNGNNTAILGNSFYATINPNLTCIQVDNVAYSTTNWTNIDAGVSFSTNCASNGLTNVPDDNFENYLETHDASGNVVALGSPTSMGNGIANDDYVFTNRIDTVTNLDVNSLSIADLTGIEDFVALTELNCENNDIASLDITQNTLLTILKCSENIISTLDITQNTALTELYCFINPLNSLNVTLNIALTRLECAYNSLTTLDVTQNTALEILDCYNNSLTTLDLSQNTSLTFLACQNNSLNGLNVSQNTALTGIRCSNNMISSLDVSLNTSIILFECNINQLTSLNVKNGNNNNIISFDATNNPSLTCIEVDDITIPNAPTWQKDATASYSTNCANTAKIWENGAWTNGAPTISDDAIIRDNYFSFFGNIEAKTLIIDPVFNVTIFAGNYIKLQSNLINSGNLTIEHEGSFVQVENTATVTNNGNIQVLKDMTSFDAGTDFAILGSPMSGETRDEVYSQNNVTMNHIAINFIPNAAVASADPLAENFADDNGNNWQFFTGSENIIPGVGYLVGGITGGGPFTSAYTLGTLNNGVVNFPVTYNGSQNASPNVLSNPYASAIDADVFINNNSIVDAVYFWEHLTPPSASYPGYRAENWDMGDISMYNLSGGIAAVNGGSAPTQYIPSGQGFSIKANALGTVSFNNSMRVTSPNTGYRNSEDTNRMYVNISNETYGLKSSTLIAFTPNATDGIEASYDAKRLATPISIFSIVEEQELAIQGRSAFNEDQIVSLGFRTQVEELQEYTISLGLIEGTEINNATIYVFDNLLQIETNLSESNYSFTSDDGNFSDRFIIYFREESLGINEFTTNSISLYPNPTQDRITISSINSEIKSFTIFDLQGREILKRNVNDLQITFSISSFNNAIYLLNIETEKGTVIKRIIKN